MSKHPLDDRFDLAESNLLEEDAGVKIPEDKEQRDLDLIIDLALKAYADLSEIVEFVEPVARVKYFAQMEGFLAQAKDARFKKEKLQLERERDKNKRPSGSAQRPQEGSEGEQGNDQGVSRKELAERLRAVK